MPRLTGGFVSFARGYRAPPGTEPKLALALDAYARQCPVSVSTATTRAIDLGARAQDPVDLARHARQHAGPEDRVAARSPRRPGRTGLG